MSATKDTIDAAPPSDGTTRPIKLASRAEAGRSGFLRRFALMMRNGIPKFLLRGIAGPWVTLATFHHNRAAALQAYRLFNRTNPRAEDELQADMIGRAVDFDHVQWPRKIRHYVHNKDILDIGCGEGIESIGYVIVGVRSYTGVDPVVKLHRDNPKNNRSGTREEFGWTPRQIVSQFSRVRLIRGTSEELGSDQDFDVAVLHNVTEHLLQIEEVLASAAARLRPGGRLIFNHHNFYCWNGHHMTPKTVDQIKADDPEQSRYLDWAHIRFAAPEGHYFHRGLNKIRLDELRAIVERYYDIEVWNEIPSTKQIGGRRLTGAVVARFPHLTRRDLAIHNVFCVAKRKHAP